MNRTFEDMINSLITFDRLRLYSSQLPIELFNKIRATDYRMPNDGRGVSVETKSIIKMLLVRNIKFR